MFGMSEQPVLFPESSPDVRAKKCAKCGELKPLFSFARRAASADGRHSRCRACDRKRHGETEARLHIRDACPSCTPAVKFCPKCSQHLRVGDFTRNRRSKDGLADCCWKCQVARKPHKRRYHTAAKCPECVPDVKYCAKCKTHKQRASFTVDQRAADGLRGSCGACSAYRLREDFLRRYGMTFADYDRLLAAQGGKCAICGGADPRHRKNSHVKRFCVDHDHATGKVRGLLCGPCNVGIGAMADDPARIRAAADYLERRRQ